MFDAGALEHLVLSDPLLEERPIKHADPEELARRVCQRAGKLDYAASMDFGSFVGSCTKEVRDIVENAIIVAVMKESHNLSIWVLGALGYFYVLMSAQGLVSGFRVLGLGLRASKFRIQGLGLMA